MVQRMQVTVVCDLPHANGVEVEVEPRPSLRFGFDGQEWEIDPCDEHRSEMTETFIAYAEHARRASTRQGHSASAAPAGRPGGRPRDRGARQHMRQWFRSEEGRRRLSEDNVPQPAERGRISARAEAVYKTYRNEHRATLPLG